MKLTAIIVLMSILISCKKHEAITPKIVSSSAKQSRSISQDSLIKCCFNIGLPYFKQNSISNIIDSQGKPEHNVKGQLGDNPGDSIITLDYSFPVFNLEVQH
jgi:hypothetical protein